MKRRLIILLGFVTAIGALPVTQVAHAQEGRLTDPAPDLPRGTYLPPNWLADDQFLRWPYPPGDVAYTDLDGFRIKTLVGEVVAISRKSRADGNQYWGRIAGTPYERLTNEWTAAQFRRIGLEQVRIQEFDLPPQWFPTSWELTVSGGGRTTQLATAFPLYNSVGTTGMVTLEPVWLGMGTTADFADRTVKGKAAVLYGFPNPGGRGNTALTFGALRRAEQAGAAAILMIVGFPGNVVNQPQGGGTMPPAQVPVLMLGDQDGRAIRELIERRESPSVRLRLDVETRTGLKTANVWGVLPGATDENIAIMAHADAFFDGAMDNASGMATLVALAEHYAKAPKAQRRRTVTFFTTAAHHSPSGEQAGISWVHNHAQAMWAKTALLVNLEHTAQVATYLVGEAFITSNHVSARRWFVGGSDRFRDIVLKTFSEYGIALYSRPEGRPGGELSRVFTDAPSVHIIDHTVYHTDMDTLAAVPASGLEQSARAFAKIIDQVNTADLRDLRGGPVTNTSR
ncbi:MAG: M28 family peptidase [Acidobacteria bacterium]|nr:M28 family peptidase [Acidobacteriota bacterium]